MKSKFNILYEETMASFSNVDTKAKLENDIQEFINEYPRINPPITRSDFDFLNVLFEIFPENRYMWSELGQEYDEPMLKLVFLITDTARLVLYFGFSHGLYFHMFISDDTKKVYGTTPTIACNNSNKFANELNKIKAELDDNVIEEMNTNSFYPAKYINGEQAVGTDCRGESQIWMIRTYF